MERESNAGMDSFDAWIGREETVQDLVTEDFARKLHATLDLPGDHPTTGDALPPLAHFCLAPPLVATSLLAGDGHAPKGGFLPPIPLPRRMWAGGRVTFEGLLRVGDTIAKTSRILAIDHKQGRSGPLCFVKIGHVIKVDGKEILTEEQDVVYRGDTSAGSVDPAPAAPAGTIRETIQPSTTLLFRYSALMFNSHRIHYDRRYATEKEGYPGLVFHGPLQATLLAGLATKLAKHTPRIFEFRSITPLYDLEPVLLNASEKGNVIDLWTNHPEGPTAMRARAVF